MSSRILNWELTANTFPYTHREIVVDEQNSLAREIEIISSMQGMDGIFHSSDANFIDGKWISSVISGTIETVEVTEFGPHSSSDGEGSGFISCSNLIEVYFYIKTEGLPLQMVNAATIYIK